MKSTLITLTEAWQIYCAKSRQIMQNRHSEIFYEFNNYINFVNQHLKLKYFIRCDKNGEPLEEPDYELYKDIDGYYDEVNWKINVAVFIEAQERILFEGFELDYSTPRFIRIDGESIFDSLLFDTKINKFYDYGGKELKSIQDLTGKVDLVERKLKELNL